MADSPDRQPDRPGPDDPGRGRRLGIDVGTVRIGVAGCDPDEVIVGLPRTLADRSGTSATDAVQVADRLAELIAPVPVRLADERLTTVSAQRALRDAGVRAKNQRAMVDQVAAVGILQTWLDQRRSALRVADE